MTTSERFWAKVRGEDVGSCWEWTGKLVRGYGKFTPHTGGGTGAHRYAYEDVMGPIPAGLDIDHVCRNRACVNPWHLEPVSRSENLRRGYAARGVKGACSNGHPFDEINTFQRSDGSRGCRTCRTYHSRASKARKTQPSPITESRTA